MTLEYNFRLLGLAIFLKGHLKLMAVGMKNSQISGTQMLAKATALTGRKYKRGQYKLAVQDLETFITEYNNG